MMLLLVRIAKKHIVNTFEELSVLWIFFSLFFASLTQVRLLKFPLFDLLLITILVQTSNFFSCYLKA